MKYHILGSTRTSGALFNLAWKASMVSLKTHIGKKSYRYYWYRDFWALSLERIVPQGEYQKLSVLKSENIVHNREMVHDDLEAL